MNSNQNQGEEIVFTQNRILGTLKNEMDMVMTGTRRKTENNPATTDYNVDADLEFADSMYMVTLNTRVDNETNQSETNVHVEKYQNESRTTCLLDMMINRANPAVVGDVAINAIRAALTRDAASRKMNHDN